MIYSLFKPLNILPGSILHPATHNKTAGKLWPLYENHRNLLLNVLPYLIQVYHCIAFWNNANHENGVMGEKMDEFFRLQVISLFQKEKIRTNLFQLKPTEDHIDKTFEHDIGLEALVENQSGALGWLKRLRYMITNLRLRETVTTTDRLQCRVCGYRGF